MANLLKYAIIGMLALAPAAEACRGPFPAPISQSEAFSRADAVFLGTIQSITPDLPADFRPANAEAHASRQAAAKRQENVTLGRSITFKIERVWKGGLAAGQTVVLMEYTPQSTCEWEQLLRLGDRMIVFAAHNGNYLTFPAQGFDGRSHFTKFDPATHYGKVGSDHPYAKAIAEETARYQAIIQSLPHDEK